MWIGALVLGVGLLVGFVPTSTRGVSCGSAFVGSDAAAVADFGNTLVGGTLSPDGDLMAMENACSDRRSVLRIPALALLVIGAGVYFIGLTNAPTSAVVVSQPTNTSPGPG